jgi:hypothetical protein
MKTRTQNTSTSQSSNRSVTIDLITNNTNEIIKTTNSNEFEPTEEDKIFMQEYTSNVQSTFIHLLTQRQKRFNAIEYHTCALAQGILPNNIRIILKPYKWPASFNEEENRENHRKEQKILNTALREIANNRLNILQISIEQVKLEINKHNEDDFLLDEIVKIRPATDENLAYYKNISDEYNKFTIDNMTIVTERNKHIQDISDTDSTNNEAVRQDTNKEDTTAEANISPTARHAEKRHKPNKTKSATTVTQITSPPLQNSTTTTIPIQPISIHHDRQ